MGLNGSAPRDISNKKPRHYGTRSGCCKRKKSITRHSFLEFCLRYDLSGGGRKIFRETENHQVGRLAHIGHGSLGGFAKRTTEAFSWRRAKELILWERRRFAMRKGGREKERGAKGRTHRKSYRFFSVRGGQFNSLWTKNRREASDVTAESAKRRGGGEDSPCRDNKRYNSWENSSKRRVETLRRRKGKKRDVLSADERNGRWYKSTLWPAYFKKQNQKLRLRRQEGVRGS